MQVFCLACGAAMLREVDPEGDPGWVCYRWFDMQHRLVFTCPRCGEVMTALTTGERPADDPGG